MSRYRSIVIFIVLTFLIYPLYAGKIDEESTRQIREYTTDSKYSTPLVDHLPWSENIPAPHQVLGYVIGTPGKMTYYRDIVRYFRELESASGRVQVFEIGKSHQGNTMIAVAIADQATIENLDSFREKTRRLADPRTCSEGEMKALRGEAKPFYMFTGGLHSPETGSPEMLMEMAYRLAASDDPFIKEIRENVITLIIPVLETDGWNRQVDWYYHHTKEIEEYEDIPKSSPPFWGNYTAHDNNRDGIMLSQPLSRNLNEAFFRFHPQVLHDLHESVPLLYISTGTGPYYPTLSPIVRNEWQWLAFNEVTQMTAMGVPGVWTWGFYTGWFPGYGAWPANNHNAISRFYETFGNAGANTYERTISLVPGEGNTSEEWFRPLPPPAKTLWSFRNNINIMQSSCLVALNFTARHRDTILENFWRKGRDSIKMGETESPHAWIIPIDQKDPLASKRLLEVLGLHRIEFKKLSEPFTTEDREYPTGSLVVRMDQPYRNFAKTLLEIQEWPEKSSTRPYDATTWSLGLMMGVETERIDDRKILEALMEEAEGDMFRGSLNGGNAAASILIPPQGNGTISAVLALEDESITILDRELEVEDQTFPPGTLVVPDSAREKVEDACRKTGIRAFAVADKITADRPISLPRIGFYSGWFNTQDPGWSRWALDSINLPWTWIDKDLVRAGDLEKKFDVIIIPHHGSRASGLSFLRGIDSRHSPLDYDKSDQFQFLGTPFPSKDITGGLGLEGIEALEKFIHAGGTMITLGSGSRLITDFGILPGIRVNTPSELVCPGTLVSGWARHGENPILHGIEPHPAIYQSSVTVYEVDKKMRSSVVMQFGTSLPRDVMNEMDQEAREAHEKMEREQSFKLSGLLRGEKSLDGTAALIDAPLGRGRVVMFAFNPLYRWMNHASFPMVYNAIINWDAPPEIRK